MNTDIEKRIYPDLRISDELYISGLLDITGFLCSELTEFLIKENRYYGITKSYMKSINEALQRIDKDNTEEDIEIYGKMLFLYKPIIVKEFNRLRNKSISCGDSVIMMIKKILEIISGNPYKHNKEVRTIRKIINKFFDNIKLKRKNDPMYNFSNSIKTFMKNGYIGKYELDHLSLGQQEGAVKEELKGSGVRWSEEDNKVKEILWKEE